MKKVFYVIASAAVSLALHLTLYGAADRFKLNAFTKVPVEGYRPKPPVRVRTTNIRDEIFKRPQIEDIREQTKRQLIEAVRNSEKIEAVFEKNQLISHPKPQLQLSGLGRNLLAPELSEPAPPRTATAPRPSILAIDAQKLTPEQLARQRPLTPKLDRQIVDADHIPSLLPPGDLQGAVPSTYQVGMRLSGLPPAAPLSVGDLPPEVIERMRRDRQDGEAEKAAGTLTPLAARPPPLPGIGRADLHGRTHEVAQLDTLMSVTMTVYEEPRSGGYFRIDISPNPRSERLRAVAKDVAFLIDSSTSISERKLEEFKAAAVEALEYLNKADRFNVVSFRDRASALFEAPAPVNAENIAAAQRFIRALQRGGMTDVFAGLSPLVQRDPQQVDRPLNIFLMSDGQTTVKAGLRDEALIQEIVRLNRADVSIFSFSAGRGANLKLLDFLAYHNRGMSLHEETLDTFGPQLVRFIGNHSDLIVADLQYHMTGGLADEVFPKSLPHLYRNETLSIYGRYPQGTEQIAMSIVGRNAEGTLEELIYRVNIKECEKTGPRLALDWAAQKVFHLIGLKVLNPDPAIDQQIRQLSERYNLYIPY